MADDDNAYKKKVQIGKGNVVNGSSDVPLQVDTGILNGEYVLYAEYSGDENYAPSSAEGILRVGYKSMVHVPRIYIWQQYRADTPLIANVYMGCYQAGQGTGYFYIDNALIDSATPSNVRSGQAKKIWDTSNLDIRTGQDSHWCKFKYNGYTNDLSQMINPGVSKDKKGRMYFLNSTDNYNLIDDEYTTLYPQMDMEPVAGKPGETVTTTAHVYLPDYGTELNPNEVATDSEGAVSFGYESMTEDSFWSASSFENGYVTLTFTLPEYDDGGYDLYAVFKHSEGSNWASTYGCTSMFISRYTPKVTEPTLTVQDISFDKGTQSAYIVGQFNPPYGDDVTSDQVKLNGYASLMIDTDTITLTNSNTTGNTVAIADNGYLEFQFSIPYYIDEDSPSWVKPGKHKITVLYHQNSTDMDYEYHPDARLIIRRDTAISIDNQDDNNGLIYLPNNGESTSIRCYVDDLDDHTVINEGSVLVSYEKSDTLGD